MLCASMVLLGVSIDGYVFSLRSQREAQGAMGDMFVVQIIIVATIINAVLIFVVLNKIIKKLIFAFCVAMVLMAIHNLAMI